MREAPSAEIDAWLRQGGLVVTASERAARALTDHFHRARIAEGLGAWPAPRILDWQGFLQEAWKEHDDGRLILNSLQEESIWAGILASTGDVLQNPQGPLHRAARLAMEAHELLAGYAHRYLRPGARAGWQQDTAAFSRWLESFEAICRRQNLLSAARLPLELLLLLSAPEQERPPLLAAGFDRMQPVQREFFEAWGAWKQVTAGEPDARLHFYEAPDAQSELSACARWCRHRLEENPSAKLLVVSQDLAKRRGEMERAFLHDSGGSAPWFEFSLGIPLEKTALARGAHLVLRWLTDPIAENAIDWLFSTSQTADPEETLALTRRMYVLRQQGRARPEWTLDSFLHQSAADQFAPAWAGRMKEAQRLLKRTISIRQNSLAWADLVPRLLDFAGWPGPRSLSSAEFQALNRWRQALDACASLGFDGRRMEWREFLAAVGRALGEMLFTPQSVDALIQIAGPAESAGLAAGAIWFLGAGETAWPAGGTTNPFLPLSVQREAGMPHASSQSDWELAQAITRRLLASADEVHFSFPRLDGDAETRPSRIVTALVGKPQPLPEELTRPSHGKPQTVSFEDASPVPFPAHAAQGGANVLTTQSQCPFRAFASWRLRAQGWEPAGAGLTAAQRGSLLHEAMHSIWSGSSPGIRSHAELVAIADRKSFVEEHVRRVLPGALPRGAEEWMPKEYLDLEATRLTDLLTAWLDYEAARVSFTVVATEAEAHPSIAGLNLNLRLDRIDRLSDGTLLVVDYKTGDVKTGVWDLPRPADVQLPQYACFALDQARRTEIRKRLGEDPEEEPQASEYAWLGGMVFAKVRPGDGKQEFAGYVKNAKATLRKVIHGNSNLVKKPLTEKQLHDWKKYIEESAEAFVAGRAEVDPRDYPDTCKYCGLQSICRVQEQESIAGAGDEADGEEAANG